MFYLNSDHCKLNEKINVILIKYYVDQNKSSDRDPSYNRDRDKNREPRFNENFVFMFCKKASFLLQINYNFVF